MGAAGDPVIEFSKVGYQTAQGRKVIANLELQVHRGELLVLLGRSASGKTTALKLINGLLFPTSGEVRIEGRSTRDWDLIRLRRRIGYAIQEVGLLPHLTVARNIALIPRLEKWPQDRIQPRTDELMRLLGLVPDEVGERYPHELSGGQKQRVGLARALAADPPILLMDEPFGALDPLTRTEVQRQFKALQQSLHKTAVLVTHDVHEALILGTRIALLDSGRLAGTYSATEFLHSPDPEAAAYISVFQAGHDEFLQ